jgi:hypothetical protein
MITITQKPQEPKVYHFKDLKPGDKFRITPNGMIIFMKLDSGGERFQGYGSLINTLDTQHNRPCSSGEDCIVYPIDLPKEEIPQPIPFKDLPEGQPFKERLSSEKVYVKLNRYNEPIFSHNAYGFSVKMFCLHDYKVYNMEDCFPTYPVDLNVEVIGGKS